MTETVPKRSPATSALHRRLKAARLLYLTMTRRPAGGPGRPFKESRLAAAGLEGDLYEPVQSALRTVLAIPGLTMPGERDSRLVNFCRALAESGLRTLAFALPAMKSFRFHETDLETFIELVLELKQKYRQPLDLVAFSYGGGLALSAAADPRLENALDLLLLFGPHYRLAEAWARLSQIARTSPEQVEDWENYVWLQMVMAFRDLDSTDLNVAEKEELIKRLYEYCEEPSLEVKKEFYHRVLQGRLSSDMDRPPALETMDRLSPAGRLCRVPFRVLILHDENDPLARPSDALAIAAELKERRLPHGGCRKMPVLSKAEEGGKMQPEEYFTYFEDCIFSPDKGFGQTRAFIDSLHGQEVLVTPLLSHVSAKWTWRFLDVFGILKIMGELFR